jgi:CheY-like chemotaxis protein
VWAKAARAPLICLATANLPGSGSSGWSNINGSSRLWGRLHLPDVALMDMRMPISPELRRLPGSARSRIVALPTYGGDEDIRRAIEAGVQAYLTKDVLLKHGRIHNEKPRQEYP